MLINTSQLRAGLQRHFLFYSAVAVFLAILFRNTGLYPSVFADEYTYSTSSRLLPLADSAIPAYLYLAIYRVTNMSGDGFLTCARILNALFFVAAAPFIYLIAARVCTPRIASLVALLAVLGPINTYTAYFMPESLYFFSFWVMTWFLLRLDGSSDSKAWCFAGILVGLSALIKPHALFLLPAIVAYVVYAGRRPGGKWLIPALRNAGLLVVCTFLARLLIGYLLAGKAGVHILGPVYASLATSATSESGHYLDLLALSTESLKGHALAICLMFGVPLVFAVNASLKSVFSRAEAQPDQRISFYALAVLLNLVLVASLVTAVVALFMSTETIERLHMRYYDFALPLLLVVAASQLSPGSTASLRGWRALLALPIGCAILYAVYTGLAPYIPSIVDNPEIRGFTCKAPIFYILGGASFCALVAAVYSARAGAKGFVLVFMPLAVALSTFCVSRELVKNHRTADVYDKAGIVTRQYLSKNDLSRLVVVGSEPAGLYRSLFYLSNPRATVKVVSAGAGYDLAELPAGKEWLLVIGDHPLPKDTLFQLPMGGFTLARLRGETTIAFKTPSWPGVVSTARGLCSAEVWGTWSSGGVVTIEFCTPLPEKFAVHLLARAFGPNVGKEFVARVGDNAVRFTLAELPEERVLQFSNPKRSKTIEIDVPSPVSARELGLSVDERKIGLGLYESADYTPISDPQPAGHGGHALTSQGALPAGVGTWAEVGVGRRRTLTLASCGCPVPSPSGRGLP